MPEITGVIDVPGKAARSMNPMDLLGQPASQSISPERVQELLGKLKKSLIERCLNAELDHHLNSLSGQSPLCRSGFNHRNGSTAKTVRTDCGVLRIRVPRDREGTFKPRIIQRNKRCFTGFDDTIIAAYAHGGASRGIGNIVPEMYQDDVSDELLRVVAEAAIGEVNAWKIRPLESTYPAVLIDALILRVRNDGKVCCIAAYIIFGALPDGTCEILGIWIDGNGNPWTQVFDDLRRRGVLHIRVAISAELIGIREALRTVFPVAELQSLCVSNQTTFV